MVNKTANMKEYHRLYREVNKYGDYRKGELDSTSNTGRGFISEIVVANTLGLESSARCNCTSNFHFEYDLLDSGGHGEINVKSSKLRKHKKLGTWYWKFELSRKYTPDTYIFVAYAEDYKDIEHVWIVPVHVAIVSDKKSLTMVNSEKGLSRMHEFEVDNIMYNVYLHTMSINNCSVLRKPDILTEV